MARRYHFDIAPTTAFWAVVTALFVCAIYFFLSVEMRRGFWSSGSDGLSIESGETVKVVQLIDGDEVSVQRGDDVFVIRLLGIKCFSSKVNEPGISQIGAACEDALRRMTENKEGTVEFDEFKQDKAGRLLAYLHIGKRDVGKSLVTRGVALVFIRYPFSREVAYLAAEEEARTRNRAMWSEPRTRERAMALKKEWAAGRNQ